MAHESTLNLCVDVPESMPPSLQGAQNTSSKAQTHWVKGQRQSWSQRGGCKGISKEENDADGNTKATSKQRWKSCWAISSVAREGSERQQEGSRDAEAMSYTSKSPEPESKQTNCFPEQSLAHFRERMTESRVSTDTSVSSIQFKNHYTGKHDI